ncbi:centriole, cilia and spindle-associated protein [Menidia menidia]
MVTKKVRTEYMKKFRDPKWETFSKCYEDSVKYRLTRRVMEHSHRPWFWEGWDSRSDSSGWSTPRMACNKVAPLSLPLPPTSSEVKQRLLESKARPVPEQISEDAGAEEAREAPVVDPVPTTAENGDGGANEADKAPVSSSGPSDDAETDRGPADSSSDGEPPKAETQRPRRRRRTPQSEPGRPDSSHDDTPAVRKKPPRAKSQPPVSTKESLRPPGRLDWTERHAEARAPSVSAPPRREPDKRSCNQDRRRARSADLDKVRHSQLTVADDRWMTEYMRCFSARLR